MSHCIGKRDNEIFVGNTETLLGIPLHLRGLKTVRLGEQAFDINGKKLDPEYMRPLFIGQSEAQAYDQIMMRRFRAI